MSGSHQFSATRLLPLRPLLFAARRQLSGPIAPAADKAEEHADVTIVGGGPIGLAIACGLLQSPSSSEAAPRRQPPRVLLLEAGRLPAPSSAASASASSGFSSRAVALSPGSVSLLRRLGAWDDASSLVRERVAPIRRMRVAESDSDAELTFYQEEGGLGASAAPPGPLAYVAELAPIVGQLVERAASVGARLRGNCRLTGFLSANSLSEQRLRLRLESGGSVSTVSTRLLIGCDGFASPVRRFAGIRAVDLPYAGYKAMVATLSIEGPSGLANEAFQRFLPEGPIALLPLPGCSASLVWCGRAERISRLANETATSEPEFLAELNRCLATGGSTAAPVPVATALQPGSRLTFPLGFMHANRYARGRVALAGDAAHRLSPLAGQGMNLGVSDAECLIRLLREALDNGADPADPTYLLEYETERQRQVVPVALVNESLGLLYSLPSDSCLAAPLRVARSIGFRLTNRFAPAKEFLRRSAASGRIQLMAPSGMLSTTGLL